MKKKLLLALMGLSGSCLFTNIYAENLVQVFQQALSYDPTYQKAGAVYRSTMQDIPISRSYLLPQFDVTGFSQYNDQNQRAGQSLNLPNGQTATFGQGNYQYNSHGYTLALTQQVFDYAAWATLSEAKISVKAANATYIAALQDLMSRTAQAYFNVLDAQDTLRYIEAEKKAIYQQLDQVTQQFKVGVVAITDVYQSQAAYDSIISQEISAANNVINQRQNLQTITGKYYNRLSSLKYNIPLLLPNPATPDKWVQTALKQNWTLAAARFTADAAREQITVERANNLPVFDAYADQEYSKTGTTPSGRIDTTTNSVGIQMTLPVFQGGLVMASTKQASYDYQAAKDQMTYTYRSVYNNAEQSYNNVVSNINQVKADRQAIVSNASSLRSTIEGFKVGTQTMLDVLQAQQNLYNAEQQFSTDQYAYINATIALKEAAGTLSYSDLQEINTWLSENVQEYPSLNINTIQTQATKNFRENIQDKDIADQIIKAGGDLSKIQQESEQPAAAAIPNVSPDTSSDTTPVTSPDTTPVGSPDVNSNVNDVNNKPKTSQ